MLRGGTEHNGMAHGAVRKRHFQGLDCLISISDGVKIVLWPGHLVDHGAILTGLLLPPQAAEAFLPDGKPRVQPLRSRVYTYNMVVRVYIIRA